MCVHALSVCLDYTWLELEDIIYFVYFLIALDYVAFPDILKFAALIEANSTLLTFINLTHILLVVLETVELEFFGNDLIISQHSELHV